MEISINDNIGYAIQQRRPMDSQIRRADYQVLGFTRFVIREESRYNDLSKGNHSTQCPQVPSDATIVSKMTYSQNNWTWNEAVNYN